MSFQATAWAVRQKCESGTEKAILLVLAAYIGPDGTCYPGQDTLADQACCSVKSVERALKAFEDRGWIARTARRRRDGSRTSDLIVLTAIEHPEEHQPDAMSDCEPTRHPVQTNPTSCPNQPDTMSGLTTFEPARGIARGISPAPPAAARKPRGLSADVEAIWTASPRIARQRSSRADVERALAAAVRRGHDPMDVRAGLTAAYASPSYSGDKAKGIHRLIECDRWQSFVEDGDDHPMTDARWLGALALHRDEGWWSDGLGPPPGRPGCRVPPHLLAPPANANDAQAGQGRAA